MRRSRRVAGEWVRLRVVGVPVPPGGRRGVQRRPRLTADGGGSGPRPRASYGTRAPLPSLVLPPSPLTSAPPSPVPRPRRPPHSRDSPTVPSLDEDGRRTALVNRRVSPRCPRVGARPRPPALFS